MPDDIDKGRSTPLDRTGITRPALRRTVEGFRITPPRLSTGRAARFAESIRARYAGRFGPTTLRANLIYQRPEYRWIVKHLLHRSPANLSLRLALTFTNTHQVVGSQPADDRGPGSSPLARRPDHLPLALASQRETLISELPARGQGALPARALMRLASTSSAPHETPYRQQSASPPALAHALAGTGRMALAIQPAMAERISRRGQRASLTHPVGRETAALAAARPVPRIVHKPQGTPAPRAASGPDVFGQLPRQNDAAGSEFPSGMTQIRSSHAPGWSDASAPGAERSLAPHQVQRLADEVVQIIDERVIARRERMGRI